MHGTIEDSMAYAAGSCTNVVRLIWIVWPGLIVKNLTLTRDVFQLCFENGTIYFLQPIEGCTVGAVR